MNFNPAFPTVKFEPSEKWFEGLKGPYGTSWSIGWDGALDGLVVPHGTDDAARQLMFWAYECGVTRGKHHGSQSKILEIKHALDIY